MVGIVDDELLCDADPHSSLGVLGPEAKRCDSTRAECFNLTREEEDYVHALVAGQIAPRHATVVAKHESGLLTLFAYEGATAVEQKFC